MAIFGKERVRISLHISRVVSLLPAMLFFKESKSFEDATVLVVSFNFFVFECLIGLKLITIKRK